MHTIPPFAKSAKDGAPAFFGRSSFQTEGWTIRRLDPQVLDWLRGKGEGHLTRINDILVNLMEAERRAGSGR
jgi:uncharacterized protein (DUF4415 family)